MLLVDLHPSFEVDKSFPSHLHTSHPHVRIQTDTQDCHIVLFGGPYGEHGRSCD